LVSIVQRKNIEPVRERQDTPAKKRTNEIKVLLLFKIAGASSEMKSILAQAKTETSPTINKAIAKMKLAHCGATFVSLDRTEP